MVLVSLLGFVRWLSYEYFQLEFVFVLEFDAWDLGPNRMFPDWYGEGLFVAWVARYIDVNV